MKAVKWERKPLGAVADLCLGKMLDQNKNRGEPLPYLANVNVRWGEFALDDLRTMRFEPKERDRYGLKFGDIIMCEGGEPGRCAIWKDQVPGMMIQKALHRIRPKELLDYRFLFYSFLHIGYLKGFDQYFTGATIKHLPGEKLAKVEIDIPPLPVQQRIAGILSAYDELIENCQRRIKILETMARALYREWFVHFRFPCHDNSAGQPNWTAEGRPEGVSTTDGANQSVPRVASPLGEIPPGWDVKKLGDISSYINRGITPRYDDEGGSVVINQKCIRDQRLSLNPARRQSKTIPGEKLVCFGDVLINSTGVGTLGRVAQVYETLENCTVDTHVTIARAGSETDLDFYGCSLLNLQETFERLGAGATGQTELGRADISDVELVVPSTDLQRQFGETVRAMRSSAVTYGKQIQNLRRTRDLLLPRLLSGQIDVEAI